MTTQVDMFSDTMGVLEAKYPNRPGSRPNAPETSRIAAAQIRPNAKSLTAAVLVQLRQANNLTADEISSRMGESVLSVRPRVAELNALSRIVDSGIRRKNESGRYAVAWRLA